MMERLDSTTQALADRWDDAKRALGEAGRRNAPESELRRLDADLDRAFEAFDRQRRRVELAAAGGKGYWR